MDLLDDPAFKNKYQKSKYRVKKWESEFMEKYGRKPNKNDIKAADNTIKESYKMYWKLKTQALEETLMDITFSDDVQTNVAANTSSNPSFPSSIPTVADSDKSFDHGDSVKTLAESMTKNCENIDPEKTEKIIISKAEFSAVVTKTDTPNVDGAWGDHLNVDRETVEPVIKKSLIIGRSSSFQLSQKMFSSSSLTKRNPRKSLSMNKSKTAKSEQNLNGSTMDSNVEKTDGFDVETSKRIFGETIRVVQGETKVSAQPINSIQQLIKGGSTIVNRKLNQGWLDRCSRENGLEPIVTGFSKRLSGTSDSGVESMDMSDPSQFENPFVPEVRTIEKISDDEDFVCNSDSEEERRNKRVRNFKKRLSDDACNRVTKRQRTDTENHFSFSQPLPDLTTNETSLLRPRQQSPNKIEQSTKDSLPTTQLNIAKDVEQQPQSNNKSEINEIDASKIVSVEAKSIYEFENDPESKSNVESTSNKTKKPRKPRATKKKIVVPKDTEDEKDEDWECGPTKKRGSKKTTTATGRIARTRRKTVETGETARSKKTTRATTARKITGAKKNTRTIDETAADDDEVANETSENPDFPIYGIEAGDVIPRFALPTNASGDLVNDFTRSMAPRGHESASTGSKTNGPLTDRQKLEKKVAAGKVNENFVRINIKKKVFVRGKKNFNFSKYKKNQWKERKKELSSSEAALDLADFAEKTGSDTCFKCGGTGHYARRCTASKSDDLLPDDGRETSEFPTLEEAEKMASQNKIIAHCSRMSLLPERPSHGPTIADDGSNEQTCPENDENFDQLFDEEFDDQTSSMPTTSLKKLEGHKIPEQLLAKLLPPINGTIEPIYDLAMSQTSEPPSRVREVLRMFGHENFRPGQEKAIMRILSGQSTLVTLSTGSGKSLCYQLPAYIYARQSKCITLVISPLVSLMDDQVVGVPSFMSAAALHTGQSPKVKEMIMDTIKQGKLDILLVSPEAVVAGEKSTGFGALLRQLPPIAFACIDEAHCISQWSHNFRPSYLMICRVLIEKLGVKTILGLTATATKSTAESIVRHLHIRDGLDGVISDTPMPKNLTLTVSRDEIRDRSLIDLLLSERFKECDSIIVYCTRREECTRIAGIIRVSLKDPKVHENPKAKCSEIAEAYHAGLPASRRKAIQKSFMSGNTRVVVATVAFGMGINKTNIRSVIHYNMPASFEGYVQEVGRAGRDNLPAHCHLFLAPSRDGDKFELRRHIFADSVDRHMIRRLLQKVFLPCSCPRVADRNNGQRCPGHEVAIAVDETVRALDISEETISTLLCYLELHPRRYVTVLSSVYVNAKVTSYGGPRALKAAAQSSPPLAMAIALDLNRGVSHNDSSTIEFPVVDVAAAIGWDSGVVKSHLKNLEWETVNGQSKRSAISVRYDTLGIRVRAPGDLTDAELDEALESLADRAREQETSALRQLDTIHAALSKYSVPSVRQCVQLDENISSKSESLKEIIRDYFRSDDPLSVIEIPPQADPTNVAEITGDVRCLISSYRDTSFTGRAVARIFHGIQSPNYPALAWSRCRYWRSHLATDFNFICRIATKEILAMR